MIDLCMPRLHASPFGLQRSGLQWLRRSGEAVAARDPIAVCNLRLLASRQPGPSLPFPEEQNDVQVVLASPAAGRLVRRDDLSRGGYADLVPTDDWDDRSPVASIDEAGDPAELVPLVLAGRRGFDGGEGRGGLLPGWHERVRGFWQGQGTGRFGTVLSLGTCEQTGVFRGADMAFLSWFVRAPGPAQLVWVSDERTVHSSAVVLQHLRRTPPEARAITEAVRSWIGERLSPAGPGAFPAFEGGEVAGPPRGRWPEAQDVLFAMYLLGEAVGRSPILERTQVLTRDGLAEQAPPDAVALSMGSEFAPHYRHKRTGWLVAIHGFRFGQFIGPGAVEWLRRDFERVPRTVADAERDLAALADEVTRRTGAALLVQNSIASSAADRVANYAWLGDAYAESVAVSCTEANLMLGGLTRHAAVSVIDSDAMAAELGVRQCPDRFHASRQLLEAQQGEVHRILRERGVPGF
jgi:hypothetical protein